MSAVLIAKYLMYGVLGGVMTVFDVGLLDNFWAWFTITLCVVVIDLLAMIGR